MISKPPVPAGDGPDQRVTFIVGGKFMMRCSMAFKAAHRLPNASQIATSRSEKPCVA